MANNRIRLQSRHVQSPTRGPNAFLDQILTSPHKMNRIRPAASIVVKCGPADNHPATCGPNGKNFGHPYCKALKVPGLLA